MSFDEIYSAKDLINFIDGEWVPPQSENYFDNVNPSTGKKINRICSSNRLDIDLAVKAARNAFLEWRQTSLQQRAQYLNEIANLIESSKKELALLESMDQGKPLWLAEEMDIARAIHNFRFFADDILKHQDPVFLNENFKTQVISKPIGVAGLISPWNLPLYLLTWKIAPAIGYGNTVVCKPSELTSLSAGFLAELIQQSSLPKGVVNFVFGLGSLAGEALVQHPDVPLISFTGGTETGKRIYQESAKNFKKLSLELGGKNPNIIFSDADIEQTIKTSLRSSFLNQGEICLCGSRIYVQKEIADQFIKRFVEETEKLKVGDPLNPENFMGALVSRQHLEKVQSFIQIAKDEGAQILTGGQVPELDPVCQSGFFLKPTVILGLQESSKCIQQEIFGPVVTISVFENEDDVIRMANAVDYGLSATIWTRDHERGLRLANQLEVGTVWLNSWLLRDLRVPFGGMKHSGLGREGGSYSKDFFTETTTFVTKLNP